MAAKGTIVKEEIAAKILEIFPTAFMNEKEIRVDLVENGAPIQIKITLTAVKSAILNTPESKVINEDAFLISDEEREELKQTLVEMDVDF
jgi:hypothetical protein